MLGKSSYVTIATLVDCVDGLGVTNWKGFFGLSDKISCLEGVGNGQLGCHYIN